MRIDRTPNIDPQVAAARTPGAEPRNKPAATPDVEVRLTQPPGAEAWANKAKDLPATDASAVSEARRLLDAGELDTPDAARRAAQRLLDFGV